MIICMRVFTLFVASLPWNTITIIRIEHIICLNTKRAICVIVGIYFKREIARLLAAFITF